MAVKISSLELENVKRVKAVRLSPSKDGLTIIGGRNGQGKTSVLDAIAWALGGESRRPSAAAREGSATPPALRVIMDNGLVVERKGKSGALKVTDPGGGKGGQQLLNEFVEQLALDLPKFMNATGKEKAAVLLRAVGVGERLAELDREEREKYSERQAVGRIADQKEKFAREQPCYPGVPDAPVSASELIREQQGILARNARNQELRSQAKELERREDELARQVSDAYGKAAEWDKKAKALEEEYERVSAAREAAFLSCESLRDEPTDELERSIEGVDETNRKVRANLDKEKAEEDARHYRRQYEALTAEIEAARKAKAALLEGAGMPLPGLSVEDGELLYNGRKWDCMSGSEQLKVSAAIVRKLKPKCGFVLLDRLEQMDLGTLGEFGEWLEAEGLQAIATRVSTGDECEIIIEDGYSVGRGGSRAATPAEDGQKPPEEGQKPARKWEKGVF